MTNTIKKAIAAAAIAATATASAADFKAQYQTMELGNFGFVLHDKPAINYNLSGSLGNAYGYAKIDQDAATGQIYSHLYTIGVTKDIGKVTLATEMEGYHMLGFDSWAEWYTTARVNVKGISLGPDLSVLIKQPFGAFVGFHVEKTFAVKDVSINVQNKTGYFPGNYFGVSGAGANVTMVKVEKPVTKRISLFGLGQYNHSMNKNLETHWSVGGGLSIKLGK